MHYLRIISAFFGILLVLGSAHDAFACGKNGQVIKDKYKTVDQIQDALLKKGLESSDLIIGVDFTASNYSTGSKTSAKELGPEFKNLHYVSPHGILNPYQESITSIIDSLSRLDKDQMIPAYGFGDSRTENTKLFSLKASSKLESVSFPSDYIGPNNNAYIQGLKNVMDAYNFTANNLASVDAEESFLPTDNPDVIFPSGPTSFVPIIDRAIEHVRQAGFSYHILLILTDGQVQDKKANADAFKRAASYPLSIIIVGVGNGPFTQMAELDDNQVEAADGSKEIDNVQFVDFHKLMKKYGKHPAQRKAKFSVKAMQELPKQYQLFVQNGLIGESNPLYANEYLERYQASKWRPGQQVLENLPPPPFAPSYVPVSQNAYSPTAPYSSSHDQQAVHIYVPGPTTQKTIY